MRTLSIALAVSLLVIAGIALSAVRYDGPPAARTFVDRAGEVIGTIDPSYQGVKIWTPLAEIPDAVVAATLQAEDRFFFRHRGINPFAIAKAAAENLARGRIVRGGSTITQQLAKLLIQEREGRLLPRGFVAKAREAALAVGLELIHSKAWILERYLNTAYYGRRAYGIAAAAEITYGKQLGELTAEEIAFLAALPKAPNRLRTPVRGELVEPRIGKVRSPCDKLRANGAGSVVGRHFIEYVQSQIAPGDARRRIETTMDVVLQGKLEAAIRTVLEARPEEDPLLTAAAVAIDVRTGELLAMVGSRDYFDAAIDGAVNAAVALRQPGSALKPFTYFAAFAKGFAPGSVVPDEPLSFAAAGVEEGDGYAPQNFDRRYHGAMTIREALANSYNVPAVATLNAIGLSFFHDLIRKFGFTTLTRPPTHYGLAVTLGAGEVTLLELTNAYAALARGGAFLPLTVERDDGRSSTGSGRTEAAPVPVAANARAHAAAVTSILADAGARLKAFGANESMTIEGHRVAIKTGTSYEQRDTWAVGYSPSIAVGVWVGHADGTPMESAAMTGATSAAPIWHAIMEACLRGRPPEDFPFLADPLPAALPARRAGRASLAGGPRDFLVTSPVANTTYRLHAFLPRPHQRIAAEAQTVEGQELALDWYLDGDYVATTREGKARVFLQPEPGKHRLRVESGAGAKQEVTFRVIQDESL